LVRRSYLDPRETIETNAIGTFNVLEAVSNTPSVKANLIITTDKVYKNVNQKKGYIESDHLGGDDPYSASKAMADIVTQSFVKSFPGIPTAIARAGNVIGGGDVSADRLIPDLINGFIKQKPVLIRYPSAVRPWQHVLDCLNGYLILVDKMLNNKVTGEWNFGPDERSFKDVKTVADYLKNRWGQDASWITDKKENPHEAELLALDATKAETQLNWHNKLSFEETLDWTLDWHKAVTAGANPLEQTQAQINKFREMN
jgi:CDP-glucose 4,6-dehydratase